MSEWASTRARQVLAALLHIGWAIKRDAMGSHRVLSRPNWPDYVFPFHDRDEVGPRMLRRIAKRTGLKPGSLRGWARRRDPSEAGVPLRDHHLLERGRSGLPCRSA